MLVRIKAEVLTLSNKSIKCSSPSQPLSHSLPAALCLHFSWSHPHWIPPRQLTCAHLWAFARTVFLQNAVSPDISVPHLSVLCLFVTQSMKTILFKTITLCSSLAVQWLILPAFIAGDTGLIPCQGTGDLYMPCRTDKKKSTPPSSYSPCHFLCLSFSSITLCDVIIMITQEYIVILPARLLLMLPMQHTCTPTHLLAICSDMPVFPYQKVNSGYRNTLFPAIFLAPSIDQQ